jgi:lipid II:glycine glycyltransferase (peptidoglycan interpeptide bridge formation enzyme)
MQASASLEEKQLSASGTLPLDATAIKWRSRKSLPISRIDPLEDPRWEVFVQAHPRASVFHTSAWLNALSRTYGYRPVVLTTSRSNQDLQSAIVFCQIDSWLTGRRLVSLPFSDHCEPLLHSDEDPQVFAAALEEEIRKRKWWYIEMRPLTPFEITTSLNRVQVHYSFHQLDLSPSLATLFENLHKNCIQRKIRRAEREGLTYEEGRSKALLESFYRLFQMTRQRHHLPPPPKAWFQNLIESFGEDLKIRVARKDGRALASILTLRHKDTLVYKYGCSDSLWHKLGGVHLLFWNSIQEAKLAGLQTFDFGRSDSGQSGLTTFKRRWGALESTLMYSRYVVSENSTHIFDFPVDSWKSKAAKRTLVHLPLGVLSAVGHVLYKHVG